MSRTADRRLAAIRAAYPRAPVSPDERRSPQEAGSRCSSTGPYLEHVWNSFPVGWDIAHAARRRSLPRLRSPASILLEHAKGSRTMDDRRFDSLAKSLASGVSRRSLIKGLLGLGGATVAREALSGQGASAARRPTPTPKPVACPGQQIPAGGACVCPGGLSRCGADCCNDQAPPTDPDYSVCCDGACCAGLCYGEERCCPAEQTFCAVTQECCPLDQPYCCSDGCCATPCCDTTAGPVCCAGDTPQCCPDDICIPAGGCCTNSDCSGCQTCQNHICADDQSQCPGCTDCVAGACTAVDTNCDDGNACTGNVCNGDGTCSNQFNCNGSNDCCTGGSICTNHTCLGDGTCDYSPNCNGNDACCDDGNSCTSNMCGADGQCSFPFNCFGDDACCPDGQSCNEKGACQGAGCAGLNQTCDINLPCCFPWGCAYIDDKVSTGVCRICIASGKQCGSPIICANSCCSGSGTEGVCD